MTPVRKADFAGDEPSTGDLSLAAAPVPKTVESVEHIAPRGTEVHKIRGSEVQIFRGFKLGEGAAEAHQHTWRRECASFLAILYLSIYFELLTEPEPVRAAAPWSAHDQR